ncbi:glucose 1-dehydrogenase [Flexibacterium corallicola]|uniref:glucose 1-dehydrogenase n=1 Tax=Flexibacterium corallicola TaxID=3037259 RepID=UPI00286ED8EA|nr:glucose 1-dehydrogenase [Pseudovibrio sp. M1P-2-3]
MRLEGKTAIVTGAASGFGKAIAQRFASEGALVIIADRNGPAAEQTAKSIGPRARAIQADVTQKQQVIEMVAMALAHSGKLDILVNNAGFSHRNGSLLEVEEETFDQIMAVNAKALYLAALVAIPEMEKNGGGVILNTASTAGLRPRPGLTWYNASKGFAITATKSMAAELGPKNIRVNALCPVVGETPMLPLFLGEDTQEKRAEFTAGIPLGRLSQPSDIASAALWLASDEAAFITGVALEVDGGRCV